MNDLDRDRVIGELIAWIRGAQRVELASRADVRATLNGASPARACR